MGKDHEALPNLHISVLILCFGIFLTLIKVFVDGEPGTLPLTLIAIGVIWYSIHQRQKNSPEQKG